MKRNLLMNCLLLAFGVVVAISAQDKTEKKINKEIRVMVKDGKLCSDTLVWTSDSMADMDFISEIHSDSVHVIKINKSPGQAGKSFFITSSSTGNLPAERIIVEKIEDGEGDSIEVKTILIKQPRMGEFELNVPPPPPPPPAAFHKQFKFKTSGDPLEELLNDPAYEVLEYNKKEKKGVETIEIKRRKK